MLTPVVPPEVPPEVPPVLTPVVPPEVPPLVPPEVLSPLVLPEVPLVPAVKLTGVDCSTGCCREAPLIIKPPAKTAAPTVCRVTKRVAPPRRGLRWDCWESGESVISHSNAYYVGARYGPLAREAWAEVRGRCADDEGALPRWELVNRFNRCHFVQYGCGVPELIAAVVTGRPAR